MPAARASPRRSRRMPCRSSRWFPRTSPPSTAAPWAAWSTPSPSSGTNDLHGGGFWYLPQPDVQCARPVRQLQSRRDPAPGRRHAGRGPIKKDKLFFFVNGDFTRRDFPLVCSIIRAGVVDPNAQTWLTCGAPATPAQCTAINGLLPRFLRAAFRAPATRTSDSRKLDYHLSDRNTFSAELELSAFLSPERHPDRSDRHHRRRYHQQRRRFRPRAQRQAGLDRRFRPATSSTSSALAGSPTGRPTPSTTRCWARISAIWRCP